MGAFSDELENKIVPEWRNAYCDYQQLKHDLKNVRRHPDQYKLGSTQSRISSPLNHINSSFRQIGSLARRMSSPKRRQELTVQVHSKPPTPGGTRKWELYETEVLMPFGDITGDKIFFARLDSELNKVNQFYKGKEEEFLGRSENIKVQLRKLKELQTVLKAQPQEGVDQNGSTASITRDDPREPLELQSCGHTDVESILSTIKEDDVSSTVVMESRPRATDPRRRPELVLEQLHVPLDTPSLAFATVAQNIIESLSGQVVHGWQSSSHGGSSNKSTRLYRKKLQHAEKMLRDACIELYRGLTFLKSFSILNYKAFSKLLSKYNKAAGRDASSAYMQAVDKAYFSSSDKVLKMMDELEKQYSEHFTDGNRKKAMTTLGAVRQHASHKVTFFLGAFTGICLSCLIAFFLVLDIKWSGKNPGLDDSEKSLYLTAMFPLFSILILLSIHLILFGWNMYTWKDTKINYSFIFGLSPKTEISYREFLLMAACLSAIVTGTMLLHFLIYADWTSSFLTALIPLCVLMSFILILFCPLNICYRASRMFLLTCLWHILLSPFYKVVMADFFLADQLTSQVFMFRNVEYVLCYSIVGHFKEENIAICSGSSVKYQAIAYIISLLPYWWRAMQCLRRWIEEGDKSQIRNGVKYLSALVAAGVALTYQFNKTTTWRVVFIIVSSSTAIYQLYWDLYIDWGLLRSDSHNRFLRDQLILKNKSIYFVSMVLNAVLRFAWFQSVTQVEFFGYDRHISDLLFASLEVVRRCMWNFFRLENEHLTNVGKFRSTKDIPLPFTSD